MASLTCLVFNRIIVGSVDKSIYMFRYHHSSFRIVRCLKSHLRAISTIAPVNHT